ncbi:unnamed protein product, partial [Amoebophrya sp. A25]
LEDSKAAEFFDLQHVELEAQERGHCLQRYDENSNQRDHRGRRFYVPWRAFVRLLRTEDARKGEPKKSTQMVISERKLPKLKFIRENRLLEPIPLELADLEKLEKSEDAFSSGASGRSTQGLPEEGVFVDEETSESSHLHGGKGRTLAQLEKIAGTLDSEHSPVEWLSPPDRATPLGKEAAKKVSACYRKAVADNKVTGVVATKNDPGWEEIEDFCLSQQQENWDKLNAELAAAPGSKPTPEAGPFLGFSFSLPPAEDPLKVGSGKLTVAIDTEFIPVAEKHIQRYDTPNLDDTKKRAATACRDAVKTWREAQLKAQASALDETEKSKAMQAANSQKRES